MLGKMLFFNEVKHVGSIETEDGERVTVHRSGFRPGHAPVGRCSGLPVSFRLQDGEERREAVDVSVVDEPVRGRARRRAGTRPRA
jgi:cold shock CspA family protein